MCVELLEMTVDMKRNEAGTDCVPQGPYLSPLSFPQLARSNVLIILKMTIEAQNKSSDNIKGPNCLISLGNFEAIKLLQKKSNNLAFPFLAFDVRRQQAYVFTF